MTDILVTAGTTLSQEVPEEELCSPMTNLMDLKPGTEYNCGDCLARLQKTVFDNRSAVICGPTNSTRKCPTVELMRRRLL